MTKTVVAAGGENGPVPPSGFGVSRRRLLAGAGGVLALPAGRSLRWSKPAKDSVAATYLTVLQEHTLWSEQQWDETIDAYEAEDFRFIVVLGNALLLKVPGFDPGKAGVSRARLRSRTLATIKRFAA